MDDSSEVQLNIGFEGIQGEPSSPKEAWVANGQPPSFMLRGWKWWLLVAPCTFFILAGQTIATLLGRFYFNQGGNSLWVATLVQSAGFPLLVLTLLFPSSSNASTISYPSTAKIALVYISLGIMVAASSLMYSYGLLYLPVSTYSLISATQLAFNAMFSYFLNSQKLTPFIFNSVILLTFSAALLGVRADAEGSSGISKEKYALGFVLTLGASALFALILSLVQLTFEKVLKKESFTIVLKMQIYTGIIATLASIIGLFASGEWRGLKGEMDGFRKGRVAYVMTLVGIGICWQLFSVGAGGLIFVVSSLFSNVISTMGLPLVPIFAVIFFHDKMDGVKVIAMLIALWGFLSYTYQHYLDDSKAKKAMNSFVSSYDPVR